VAGRTKATRDAAAAAVAREADDREEDNSDFSSEVSPSAQPSPSKQVHQQNPRPPLRRDTCCFFRAMLAATVSSLTRRISVIHSLR